MDLSTSSELVLGSAGGENVLGTTFGSFGESCVTTSASVSIFRSEASLDASASAVASWAPPESAKYGGFTLPAYTESNGGQAIVWGIQGGNQLLSWMQGDTTLNKVKRSALHSPAFAIMPCAVTRAATGGKKQTGGAGGELENLRVVVVVHVNGDLSVHHGSSLAPLASWTALLEVPTPGGKSAQQQPGALLWCTAIADGILNTAALDVANNPAKELSQQSHLQPGASRALALLNIEQSASSDASDSRSDSSSNSGGGASVLVLQRAPSSRNGASTSGVVLHVLRLDATSAKDSSANNPQAFALDRSSAHTFAEPSPRGNAGAVANQTWAVQAAFGGSTLSLLWCAGAAAWVQAFEFPASLRGSAGSYSSAPALVWQRQLRDARDSRVSPRLAALGSDHVALLVPVDGVASSSCLALVDIRHGVVVARTSTYSDEASRAALANAALGQGGGLAACMLDPESGPAAAHGSSSGAAFATLVAYSSSSSSSAASLPSDAGKPSTAKKGKKARSSSVDLSAELESSASSASLLLVPVRTDRRAPQPGSLAAIVGCSAADTKHGGSDSLFLAEAETAPSMVNVNLSLQAGSSCSALGFRAGGGAPSEAHWHTNVVAPAAAAESELVASVVAAATQREATAFTDAYASLLAAFAVGGSSKTTIKAAAESSGAEAKKRKRTHEAFHASGADASAAAAACARLSEETVRLLVACAAAFPHPGSLSCGTVRDLLAAQRLSGRTLFFPLRHDHENFDDESSKKSSSAASSGTSTSDLAANGERLLPWLLRNGELSLVETCVGAAVPDLPDDDVILAVRTLLGGFDDAALLAAASSAGLLQHLSTSAEGEPTPADSSNSSRKSSKKAPKATAKASSSAAQPGGSSADPLAVRAVAAERLLACALAAAAPSSSSANGGSGRPQAAGAAGAAGSVIAAPLGLGAARRSLLTSACRNMDEREAACVLLLLRKLAQRVADGEKHLGGNRYRNNDDNSSSSGGNGGGEDNAGVVQEGAGRAPRVPLPNLGTIAEWCSALLDAHFTAFLVGQHQALENGHRSGSPPKAGGGGPQAAALTVGLKQLAQLVADEVAAFSLRTDLMARIGVAMANSAEQARRLAAAAAAGSTQQGVGGRHGSAQSKSRSGGFGSGEVDESAMQEYSVEVFSM